MGFFSKPHRKKNWRTQCREKSYGILLTKNQYSVVPPGVFTILLYFFKLVKSMLGRIKRFQLSWMAVNSSSWMESSLRLSFKISTIYFQLDLDLDYSLAMSLILYTLSDEKLYSLLLYDKIHYHSEKWLYHHQTNFLLMEWENHQEFQCTHVYWLLR